ncbi:50S ribosomal protein L32 [Candidatus Jorgensenbacteria bacterium RIFCSPLOWO2_01_FULL_45_25b]|uniref:Large ribosomal subunit protein bL32 n=1 Tax=Candidatus Jorgensenbacteria bacterium RIFCSPLOWO2_01_FULL_45_25b TaxID=1798471 RepID=A0A1F6BT63_9BACT|nr:MAG: 50S ribosomal protein L32 [Candidatus Jorgensenbacteria bacterium RIFCSPLOWO2_01_FULL_45_25b]
MGGVPVKHHSKSKVGRRRSHLALKTRRFVACVSCNSPKLPHATCSHCGTYKKNKKKQKAAQATESSK